MRLSYTKPDTVRRDGSNEVRRAYNESLLALATYFNGSFDDDWVRKLQRGFKRVGVISYHSADAFDRVETKGAAINKESVTHRRRAVACCSLFVQAGWLQLSFLWQS